MHRHFLHHTLKESSLWLLLAALVFAPWAYGCTPLWASGVLDSLLGTVFLLWLASVVAASQKPPVAATPLACAVLLVVMGAFMAWNAHFRHNPVAHSFERLSLPGWRLPGAIDGAASWSATLHAAVMLGILLLVCDLACVKLWRRRIMATMALSGTSVLLLGLLQKATNASMIFWQPGHAPSPFFATYYYHGNAGSFINLVLPFIAGFALRSLRRGGGRAIWLPALLIALAAPLVNVSRAGSFLSALIVLALVLFEIKAACNAGSPISRLPATVVAGVLCVALGTVAAASGSAQAWEKWGWLKGQLNEANPRYIVAAICCDMVKDSGFWGFGPGTFALAFPHYTTPFGDAIRGVWRYAHQDYLQTLIEWGCPGFLLWTMLLLGAVLRIFRGRNHPESDSRLRFTCGLALVGVALHALVDFPLQIPSLQLYTAVLAGIAWSRAPLGDSSGTISPPRAALRSGRGAPAWISSASCGRYHKAPGETRPSGHRGRRLHSRHRG